jgi:hypothetical protein
MTSPSHSEGTSTLPPPPTNGQVPPELPKPQARPGHTRISGIRTALIAGTAGPELRRIMRRNRNKAQAS